MEDMAKFKCKAGFVHELGEDCGHIIPQAITSKRRFELPEDFYSPEATKRRREENRKKYAPHVPGSKPVASVANEVWELSSRGGRPTRVDRG